MGLASGLILGKDKLPHPLYPTPPGQHRTDVVSGGGRRQVWGPKDDQRDRTLQILLCDLGKLLAIPSRKAEIVSVSELL